MNRYKPKVGQIWIWESNPINDNNFPYNTRVTISRVYDNGNFFEFEELDNTWHASALTYMKLVGQKNKLEII